jgi:hypothetical protein
MSLSQIVSKIDLIMRIPEDLVIPDAKITGYLLEPKPRNDKSKF